MVRDFGAGLTIDDLIGMSAWHICAMALPHDASFQSVHQSAKIMAAAQLESYVLAELWADGHTVWHTIYAEDPITITPNGQIIRTQG